MFKYASHLLSIDENRASITVLSFILMMILNSYYLIAKGDIPPNALTLTQFLGGYVAAVNLFNKKNNDGSEM